MPLVNLQYSPDGHSLVVGMWGGALVMEAKTGDERVRIPIPGDALIRAQFSPNGRRIMLAEHSTRVIRIFDVSSAQELLRLGGDEWMHAYSATFSPDGNQLLILSNRPERATIWRAMPKYEYERRRTLLGNDSS